MNTRIEGKLDASGIRFGIVVSRFNSFITDQLLSGAIDTIVRHGGSKDNIKTVFVPGSFEIPLACKALTSSVDAVIALGAVIRGATPHFEYVSGEVASGVSRVSYDTGIPTSFGVLTTDTIEQAIERSGTKAGNKGSDATLAVIEMVNVLNELKSDSGKLKKVAG